MIGYILIVLLRLNIIIRRNKQTTHTNYSHPFAHFRRMKGYSRSVFTRQNKQIILVAKPFGSTITKVQTLGLHCLRISHFGALCVNGLVLSVNNLDLYMCSQI